jgi:molybdopterin molybdotransferase
MISVEEAKQRVVKNSFKLPKCKKHIADSLGSVLSEPIVAPIAYPPFDQSAMDGFAISMADVEKSIPLDIIGESAAGIPYSGALKARQAIQIFTGAKIPEGADAVVMQEKVSIEKGKLTIQDKALEAGSNIRTKGSQIKQQAIVLDKGLVINPGAIGLLASLGIREVNVYSNPRVRLIVTGNELIKPGNILREGEVYESNSYCIKAALESVHCKSVEIVWVGDNEKQTEEKLKIAIENSDIVLATGGISVGKYDFVGNALTNLGVQNIFYKVFQKPGKPLYFGKLNSCLIFGLPGNPAAALTCFYEYVLTAIKMMQGRTDVFLPTKRLPLVAPAFKKEGLSLFLKGKLFNEKVSILEGQESSNISSFSTADCLVYLPARQGNIAAEELVEIHIIP